MIRKKRRRRLRKIDAFISYPSRDKAVADAVCAKLEAEGIRCCIAPRDIPPSENWAASIVDAIGQCRVMVLIFSGHANRSKQVQREVQQAFDGEKPVLPFRIEDVRPEQSLRYYLGSVHWLDALTPPLEGHLQKLAEKVKAILQLDKTKEKVAKLSHPCRPHSCAPSLPAVVGAKAAHAGWFPRVVRWGMVVFAVTDFERLLERFIEFVNYTITLVT